MRSAPVASAGRARLAARSRRARRAGERRHPADPGHQPQQPDRRHPFRGDDGADRRRGRAGRGVGPRRRDLSRRRARRGRDGVVLGTLRPGADQLGPLQGLRAARAAARLGRGARGADRRAVGAQGLHVDLDGQPQRQARHRGVARRRARQAPPAYPRHPQPQLAAARGVDARPRRRVQLACARRRRHRLLPLRPPDRRPRAGRAVAHGGRLPDRPRRALRHAGLRPPRLWPRGVALTGGPEGCAAVIDAVRVHA